MKPWEMPKEEDAAVIVDRFRFGVITEVPDLAKLSEGAIAGNMACSLDVAQQKVPNDLTSVRLLPPQVQLALRTPVFTKGEVLILDLDGREVTGKGRKPDKWDVKCELFATLEEAVKRAKEVQGW